MLNSMQLGNIVNEFKAGYQIPPYVKDETLEQLARESEAFMMSLNPLFMVDADLIGRALMKDRMFYAYNHRANEFQKDYNSDLVTWQLSCLEGD